jgi:Protein of unknown function (DUF998)
MSRSNPGVVVARHELLEKRHHEHAVNPRAIEDRKCVAKLAGLQLLVAHVVPVNVRADEAADERQAAQRQALHIDDAEAHRPGRLGRDARPDGSGSMVSPVARPTSLCGADTCTMTTPEVLLAWLGLIAAGLTAGAAVLVVGLHVLPTDVDAVREGVSGYALGEWAVLYRAQVIGTGVAAALIVVGCSARGIGSLVGLAALVVYAAARFAIVRYPTDPRGTVTLTTSGRVHVLLAATAFLSLALAAPTLGFTLAASTQWGWAGPILSALSVAVPATVVATFAAGGWPPFRALFGLIERTVYATGISWLLVVSLGLAAGPITARGR